MSEYLEATWETGQNGWSAFSLLNPSGAAFGTSSTSPAYMGTYGTFRADTVGHTTGWEKQQASLNADPSGSFTSTPTKAYASFAFRLNSITLSSTGANFTSVNTQRDFLVWSRMFNVGGSIVTDGGSPQVGANVKMSTVKIGTTTYFFLNHVEGGVTIGRYPPNNSGINTPMPIASILGKWMAMEWYVEVLRGSFSGRNGLIVTARMSYLDAKRPRPVFSWYLHHDVPTDATSLVPYTSAYSVEDICIGANKLRTTSAVDDEVSIDYDEFRAGHSYEVAFPRKIYGGPWNVQARLSMWDPGSNNDDLNDFSGRWQFPMEAITSLEMRYDGHFFSNGCTLKLTDRGVLSSEQGTTSGTPTTTVFNTNLAPQCANVYVGREIEFIETANANLLGAKSTVTVYAGGTNRTITVSPALPVAPTAGDIFVVRKTADWYATFLERGGPSRGTQLRLDIMATDSRLRDFQNHSYTNPAYPDWDEVGPIWGSFFIDRVELNDSGQAREITIEGYGPSEFLKRTRSKYSKDTRTILSLYAGADDSLTSYDHAIDLRESNVENQNVRLPFQAYGENLRDVETAIGRLLGSYVFGIETYPYKDGASGSYDTMDFRDHFLESRDDRDLASSDFVMRTIPYGSPNVTRLLEKRDDSEYANKWKFDGAKFVGEIKTVLTARGRKTAGKPGFSSDPFLRFASNADEKLSQSYPVTGLEKFPYSFVGWKCEIVDLINRVGFYRTSDDAQSNARGDSSQFQYEGGSRGIPVYAKGLEELDIIFWNDVGGTVSFQTIKNFPGAASAYETMNTKKEGVIIRLTPNDRNVERVVYNSKASVFPAGGVGVAVGDRAKIVQSADVIGWLQAGIAAQIDCFHQARAAMSAEVEEWMVTERPVSSTDNRVALTDSAVRMIIMGTSAAGGDNWRVGQLDESGRVPKVGYAKLYQVKQLTLTMTTDGWKARWELGSRAPSVGDVLARFGEQQQKG